jgi:hypothetical protein
MSDIEPEAPPRRRRRVVLPVLLVAVAAVAVGGTLGVLALVNRDDGPNDATRLGCRIMAEARDQMNPTGFNRDGIRDLIGDAMFEFRDSNDDVIRDAASGVELSYTSLDNDLFRSSMRASDDRCHKHYASGWE